jgi:hypothetical protein
LVLEQRVDVAHPEIARLDDGDMIRDTVRSSRTRRSVPAVTAVERTATTKWLPTGP